MENLLITTFTRDDFKEIIKECLKEEIGKIKVLPESQKYPIAHFSVKELMVIFKVSKVTIGDWTKKGILKAYRVGKRLYYKREDVEATLKSDDVPMRIKTKMDLENDKIMDDVFFKQKKQDRKYEKWEKENGDKPNPNSFLAGWKPHD